jgi:hypothetical protein
MLAQFRRLFRPTRASRSKQPQLPATTSRTHHTASLVSADEQPQPCRVKSSSAGSELTSLPIANDPYLYTTGRWLNHDKLHREARHVRFDFAALCAKAVNVSAGATKVVQYEKKREASTESSYCL